MLIEKSNSNETINSFNPAVFVNMLNKIDGFDEKGNVKFFKVTELFPKFKYTGTINLRSKTKQEKLSLIKQYIISGHYLMVEVKGATKDNEHWVAISKIDGDNIIMLDPASNQINMWQLYDYKKTSQFIYFSFEVNS